MPPFSGNILLTDDDPDLRRVLRRTLDALGFKVLECSNGEQALRETEVRRFDAILLDVNMPGIGGIQTCRQIRSRSPELQILMLTVRDREADIVEALDAGADDYITKPFSPRELVARLKAVLRRAGPTDGEAPIEVGGLLLDPISHRVTIDGKPAEMGPTEYRLLQFFMTHQERAYTRGQLLDQVWGGNVYVEERTVDVHIRRLRKALGDAYENLVQTVRGTGYRFSTKG